MKKLSSLLLVYLVSTAAIAQTCPASNQIFTPRDHGYDVVAPAGWRVTADNRQYRHRNVEFSVAAWGDHKHPTDNVRCHYYDTSFNDHIQLETTNFLERSRLSAQWRGTPNDNLYAICGSDSGNVNECTFA